MRVAPRYKPEEAVARDESRPALTMVHLDTDAEKLYATDSFIMVAIPVAVAADDVSGPVPSDALREARKRGGGLDCAADTVDVPGYATFRRRVDVGKLPDYEKVLSLTAGDPVVTVGFDIDFLYRAAAALGGGRMELSFFPAKNGKKPTEQAILLRALDDLDARALVMPVKLK